MKLQSSQVAEKRLREDQHEAVSKQDHQQVSGFQPDEELTARRHKAALRQQAAEGKEMFREFCITQSDVKKD